MFRNLCEMQADGLISTDELAQAKEAHFAMPWNTTTGYEVEVFESAAQDVTHAGVLHDAAHYSTHPGTLYGYKLGDDAYYELVSPYFRSPTALAIATRGIQRAGYLPHASDGLVGAHVTIGKRADLDHLEAHNSSFVHMLRIVEMLNGTTPHRLSAPLRSASNDGGRSIEGYSWAQWGKYGVNIEAGKHSLGSSTKNRVEFRTLGYYTPEQFGTTLEYVYLFARAITATRHSRAHQTWRELERWLITEAGFPDIPKGVDGTELVPVQAYLEPYIDEMNKGKGRLVACAAREAAHDIQSAFGVGQLAA